jgi:hypothetical protein
MSRRAPRPLASTGGRRREDRLASGTGGAGFRALVGPGGGVCQRSSSTWTTPCSKVALPTLVGELAATSSQLQWIVDSYAMLFAGLLLVGGRLAERFGRKRLFLVGLAVFAGGSVGAALSGSVDLLIGWRAVMGAGAAMTIPSSLSILNDVFRDPTERARAIRAGPIDRGIALGCCRRSSTRGASGLDTRSYPPL